MELVANFFRACTLLLIYLLAFSLPFGFILGPLTVLTIGCWFFSGGWKEKLEKIKSAKFLWIWIAFYFLYVISLFWTENLHEGWISLEVKLPLLFLPIVFATIKFDLKQTRWILAIFMCGIVGVGLFMLARSTYFYLHEGRNTFYYQEFSDRIMHPSYLSMIICAGVMTLFHGILLQSFSKAWKLLAILMILFFTVIIFLLSSKMGIISLVIIFVGYVIYSIIRFKRYFVGVSALLAIVLGFFIAMKCFPNVAARLETFKSVLSSSGPIDPTATESNRVRVLIWEADYAIAERNILYGVGAGDVQDSLMQEYKSRGMTGAYDHKFNAHSQLFQTTIALGIPGLVLLLLLFGMPMIWAIRNQFGFIVLFAALFLLNSIPESTFQLQAGVTFFSFFYSVILYSIDKRCLSPMKAPPISFFA